MLELPKGTELSKQLPKKAIYAKFNMNTAAKDKLDADISRITIVNEISASTTAIAEGEKISSFYVLEIALKKKDFDEKTIVSITKLIPQNLLLLLECENEGKLAIYHNKLMQTDWKPKEELSITLKGLNLDAVWENLINDLISNEELEIESKNLSIDEKIEYIEQKHKLEKEIARLEKQARAEKQPKKKFELVQKVSKLKKELEKNENG